MLVLARRGASREQVRDAIVVAFMRGARLQARLDRAAVNEEATTPPFSGAERRAFRGRTVP
jgi:hypothetical protein